MKTPVHILMTGAGAPGAAGVIKCLLQSPNIQLTVADADENAVGRHLHARFQQIPNADDDDFTETLLCICREEKVQMILPLVTKELFPLAQQKTIFEKEGIKVLVSPFLAIQVANDKGRCYHFLQEQNILVPRFAVVNTVEEFIHAAFELGHPQSSFCFKPCIANGSRGFRIVSDSINEAELLFGQKPFQTYMSYSHALKILSMQPFPQLLVTEYLPGQEYSVDCLAQHGRMIVAVPRTRQKMINGISVQGEFVYNESINGYCAAIIQTIGLHGNIGIQLKLSASGQPLLLEINPRVQGTIVSALGAGINLPLLAVKQEEGEEILPEDISVRWGTRFSRFWSEVYY